MIIDYATKKGDVNAIQLHVQVNNETAIKFYEKFGFEIASSDEKYYTRVQPAAAYILKKKLL